MPDPGELVVILLILNVVALWIWMLVDCATREPPEGRQRLIWILVIVLAQPIGALLYLLIRRPRRKKLYEQ